MNVHRDARSFTESRPSKADGSLALWVGTLRWFDETFSTSKGSGYVLKIIHFLRCLDFFVKLPLVFPQWIDRSGLGPILSHETTISSS